MSDILIAYYSRKGENYWGGKLRNLEKGNTQLAAEFIQKATGGELFEIETVKPYSEGYNECVVEARAEFQSNARPELKALPESVDRYDTVFIGYPNWCGTMPMAVFTFLESFDFSDKTVIPFCTNEGSGLGKSVQDIRNIFPGADIRSGLSIRGYETAKSEKEIASWAKENL